MNTAPTSSTASQQPLSELENEVVALFVDLVRWFGAPKSLGAIYGLLFVSDSPICFEQIATRLQMSNGSVSQGLKTLKDIGAVKTAFFPGERRDYFVAETQLRHVVSGFLWQRAERQFSNAEGRLSQLFERASANELSSFPKALVFRERLELLRRWQNQARTSLPVLLKVFGP